MNNFEITPSPNGKVLSFSGRWQKEYYELCEDESVVGIEAWPLQGEYEPDCDYLADLRNIVYYRCAVPSAVNYEGLYSRKSLKAVKLLSTHEASIEFDQFSNLEHASLPSWHDGLSSIFECASLRSLSLLDYKCSSSGSLNSLNNLEVISISGSSLEEIDFCAVLPKLSRVELALMRKVKSIEPLSQCQALRLLLMHKCNKLSSCLPIRHLKMLQFLNISNRIDVKDLSFLYGLDHLIFLFLDINVSSGDLSALKELPSLKICRFPNKRHYNVKCSENADFLPHDACLSDTDEYYLRNLTYGTTNW